MARNEIKRHYSFRAQLQYAKSTQLTIILLARGNASLLIKLAKLREPWLAVYLLKSNIPACIFIWFIYTYILLGLVEFYFYFILFFPKIHANNWPNWSFLRKMLK